MHRPETNPNLSPTKAAPATVLGGACFRVWLVAALLALVTVALYWPAMRCDFINLDDPNYVTENPHIQGGLNWAGVKWAFSDTKQAAYWAPLMWLSHMLTCQIFGMDPWGHHLINVLLHAINVVLVFWLLRNLTGAFWRSALVAALFGLHPMRVESVVWVTERKDVLSTCFGLLMLIFYARYAQIKTTLSSQRPTLDYILALLFFALGLMSKAMLVTVPCVMLLLDYWPLERSKIHGSRLRFQELILEKLPFFGLAVVMSIVTYIAQKNGDLVSTMEGLPFGTRCGNALISYCRYLGKTFWPTDLAAFYPYHWHWPLGQVILAGMLILSVTALFMVERRRYPYLLVGWLWFVGTLVPVIQLVQAGEQSMADRFTYVPSIGLFILVIWGGYELTRRWQFSAMMLAVIGGFAVVFCSGMTRQQIGYWRDSETLFRHVLAVTENNYIAHQNLGNALLVKGQTDEAINQFQEAIRLKPNYANAHYNVGTAFGLKGRFDEAIDQFQEAIRLNPDYAEAHYNLGVALDREGRTGEAISQLQEAIRLNPDDAGAHDYFSGLLVRNGQIDEAISQFQEIIRLAPDNAQAHYNLGIALGKKGQIDEAISQFQEAIRLNPDYAAAHCNLDRVLALKNTPAGR